MLACNNRLSAPVIEDLNHFKVFKDYIYMDKTKILLLMFLFVFSRMQRNINIRVMSNIDCSF